LGLRSSRSGERQVWRVYIVGPGDARREQWKCDNGVVVVESAPNTTGAGERHFSKLKTSYAAGVVIWLRS
jgi:hypothetical protein